MKKLLVLACAASALALTSSANADNYSISITGNVQAYCKIAGNGTPVVSAGTVTAGVTTSGLWALGTALSDANGIVQLTTFTNSMTIGHNGSCTATLSSDNAGLKNADHSNTYSYNAALGTNSAVPVTSAAFSSFTLAYNTNFSDPLAVSITIPSSGTSAVAAGSYSDVLRLTLAAAV